MKLQIAPCPLLVLGMLSLITPACDSQEVGDEVDDEARLLVVAEANGFDVSDYEYDGEILSVGDVAFGPHHLEEYDSIIAERDGLGDFRGYHKNLDNKVISPGFRDICLRIDNSGSNSASSWFSTFDSVADTYNAVSGSSLDFIVRNKSTGCPSSREVIDITTKNFSGDKLGEADWPTKNVWGNTKPGKWIKLDRGRTARNLVASHELMHALGFVHIDSPKLSNYDWVSGTCASSASCSTIMFSSATGSWSSILRSDDTDLLQQVY